MILQIGIVIILIVLVVLLLFLKPLHIFLTFNNNNGFYGKLFVKHYILNLVYDFEENTLRIILDFKFREFTLKIIHLETDDDVCDDDEIIEDSGSDEDNESSYTDKVQEVYPVLKEATSDLYEIVVLVTRLCYFKESYAQINFGVMDNNLTIKICNYLWALTAPLYPLDINVLIIPEINQKVIKMDVDLSFDIILMNILKIMFKIITSKKILKLVNIIRKWWLYAR